MSALRSALQELRSQDLRHSSDEELELDLAELERAAGCIEAEASRRLAEAEARRSYLREGHLSLSSWLAHHLRMPHSVAAGRTRVARALEAMPRTREALAHGDLPRSAVRVLVAARECSPETFSRDEETLVEAAQRLSARDLRRALSYWRHAADPDRATEDAEELVRARRLHVSPTFEGMVRVDGDLDPDTGQTLISALRAVEDAAVRTSEDHRTHAQRRADALGEICRRWLNRSDRPAVAGERPHVTVMVDLEALEGRAGSRCELEDTGPIPPETARRWACDASVVGPRWSPRGCGERSWCATATVGSPAVTGPSPGVTPTTFSTGPTGVPRRWATSSCCAGPTTARCTSRAGTGFGWWTGTHGSHAPTANCWRSGRHPDLMAVARSGYLSR